MFSIKLMHLYVHSKCAVEIKTFQMYVKFHLLVLYAYLFDIDIQVENSIVF